MEINSGDFVTYEYAHNNESSTSPGRYRTGFGCRSGNTPLPRTAWALNSSETKPFFASVDFATARFLRDLATRPPSRHLEENRHLSTALSLEQNWLRLQQATSTELVMCRHGLLFTPFITLANSSI